MKGIVSPGHGGAYNPTRRVEDSGFKVTLSEQTRLLWKITLILNMEDVPEA